MNDVVIRTPPATNRTSESIAITSPIPAHAPLIAVTTGLRSAPRSVSGRRATFSPTVFEVSARNSMSMPGQKPRPAPVITTARTSGSSSARSTSSKNAACIGHVHTFIRSGTVQRDRGHTIGDAPEHVGVVVGVGHRGTVCSCLASGQRDGRSSRDWMTSELGLLHRARVPGAARLGRAVLPRGESIPSTSCSRARRSRATRG